MKSGIYKVKLITFFVFSVIFSMTYAATSYPLKITTPNGTTIIKSKPQRIVVLEFGLMDELDLLLDVNNSASDALVKLRTSLI